MLEHIKIQQLDDFFLDLDKRSRKGIFFYRINGYNRQIGEFIKKYYGAARTAGVVIEGRIPNPDDKNLSYFNEMIGMDFQLDREFLASRLRKWLPRMDEAQRNAVSAAVFDTLEDLRRRGKNENMLKNVYIKFMCWLYYRFERIVSQLGNNKVPKILYEGEISNYELLLVRVLAGAGCDVVLLQYGGDRNYLKADPDSEFSEALKLSDMTAFPPGFSLGQVRNEIQSALDRERLYGQKPSVMNCTNAWMKGEGINEFKTPVCARGTDAGLFYNGYCRINGVEDKLTYANELYQLYLELKNSKRRTVIIDHAVPQPSVDEIGRIRRKNYSRQEQMIMDLSGNLQYTANPELQRLMVKSFVDVMLEESGQDGMSLNKLTNRGVYLLCWINRYREQLFSNWKMPEISCFIHMGPCRNESEALFMRFLARLPIDVLILNPDLNAVCCLRDSLLYEVSYPNSLALGRFPQESTEVQMGTAAYYAEQELDSLMYQDSGMYRNQQYGRAVSITLKTMYEEIALLWNEELRYRPNFSTVEDRVNMPVIFAKASGVKDGQVQQYWAGIKALLTKETFLITQVPFIKSTDPNPIKPHAADFLKGGKLQRERIKSHPDYQYGVLRENVQEHILDKLQLLIDQRIIKGTFENGMEYNIVSTVLHMKKELVRMVQRFDFTKLNPKIVHINATETCISPEDTILMAFLNLLGFDIVFFVPTGYQTIEKFFNRKLVEEYQLGEYMYDLQIPGFGSIPSTTRPTWRDIIFKRGT
ncbi:MAG: YceG family protein [Kineothrix sp.]